MTPHFRTHRSGTNFGRMAPDALRERLQTSLGAAHALARAEAQLSERDMDNAFSLRLARAYVAIAERRWDDAAREARLATMGSCQTCGEFALGMAYAHALTR